MTRRFRSHLALLVLVTTLLVPATATARDDRSLDQVDPIPLPMELITPQQGVPPGEGWSESPVISADGRYVAFVAFSSLLPSDTNEGSDIYVFDRSTRTYELIGNTDPSVLPAGGGFSPAMSADGRYIAFATAVPFVADDENGMIDIYLHDRQTKDYERISLAHDGSEMPYNMYMPALSADGNVVAFVTDAPMAPGDDNARRDIYVVDHAAGTLERVFGKFGTTLSPSLSGDGRFLAFASDSPSLVPDDTNGLIDAFVLDRQTGEVERVSETSDGEQANGASTTPSISADGRYVVFESMAANLANQGSSPGSHVFVRDREMGTTWQIDVGPRGEPPNNSSTIQDGFDMAGTAISPDGRFIAYSSHASNLYDVLPDNIGRQDVYLYDMERGNSELVSRSIAALPGDDASWGAAVSSGGTFVAFVSLAGNLVYGDANPSSDIFVREMGQYYPETDFDRTWARTDYPVLTGLVSRTWMWGPPNYQTTSPTYAPFYEPYGDAFSEGEDLPYDLRAVQYFDKSRMEINHPAGDPDSPWFVTNGLLVVELMSGELQLGDNRWLPLEPAEINAAGDHDDPTGPTYATFNRLGIVPPLPPGTVVTRQVDRAGTMTDDPDLASYGVTTAIIDEVTNHAIATPFWEFMNSTGQIWTGADLIEATLFENPYYATGRPITEAYWARVKVAGIYQDVLIQCFERRVLTYTPGNAPEWRVEAGNVGQHYFAWRYGPQKLPPETPGQVVYASGGNLTTLDHEQIREMPAPAGGWLGDPAWSPDGTQIAFTHYAGPDFATPADIYIMNADGTGERRITTTGQSSQPSWSPDGSRIVYVSAEFPHRSAGRIQVADIATGEQRDLNLNGLLPRWSPAGDHIALVMRASESVDAGDSVVTVSPTGEDIQLVARATSSTVAFPEIIGLDWSPDGSRLLYVTVERWARYPIHVVGADGSDDRVVFEGQSLGREPRWSPDGQFIVLPGNIVVSLVGLDGVYAGRLLWDIDDPGRPLQLDWIIPD